MKTETHKKIKTEKESGEREGPRGLEEHELVLHVCSAATEMCGCVLVCVVGFEHSQRGCAGLTGERGEKGSWVGGEWTVSVAVRGAVPEPAG